jgi:Outer membrane protein/protective antigen OMA87
MIQKNLFPKKLIPKVRSTFDVSYVTDPMSDFFGFNGYQSIYSPTNDQNRVFYKNSQSMFRVKTDFLGNFGDGGFGWEAGYTFYNFKNDTVNISRLGVNYVGQSLFSKYKDWGLIQNNEANGGQINYLKVGLKYDSRDQLACPMKGIFTEAVIQTAPKLLNQKYPHSKFALIHRQYFKIANDFSFAYRLDYQTTVGKEKVPYYAQPLLITSYLIAATNQGLGGKSSIRGILRNRIIGDAVGFGNFEFRYKFLRFEWLRQNFYLGTNVFFDSGIIFKPIDISQTLINTQSGYFKPFEYGKFHSAAGLGLKIGWNENFVISADYGKAFEKQDGNAGTYIGLNYLF